MLAAASYGAGRYTAPTKIEERERIVERIVTDEKAVSKAVSDARSIWEREVKDNTRIVTRYLDGKVIERVEYRDRDTTSSGGKVEVRTVEVIVEKQVFVDREVVKEKIVTNDPPRVAIFGTVGIPFSGSGIQPLQFGAAATARVLGPISVIVAGSGGASGGVATGGLGIAF